MAKKKESKKFIVSCRINDSEMNILQKRARRDGVSITQLLRNSLDFSDSHPRRQGFCETKQAC